MTHLEHRDSGMEVEMEAFHLKRMTAKERKSLVEGHRPSRAGLLASTLSFATQVPSAFLRRRAARILYLSFKWQVTVSLIVVLDVVFLIAEQHWEHRVSRWSNGTPAQRHEYAAAQTWHTFFQVWSVVVTGVYISDIVMRIRAFGTRKFFRRPLNILDLAITALTTINSIVLIILENKGGDVVEDVAVLRLFRAARLLRMILSLRQVLACRCLTSARYAVTGNRRRYVDIEQDFDLDLSYITPRVIAMSVPAEGWMDWWNRNNLSEVARFFETTHRDKYRIYNCCPEMPYPESAFGSVRDATDPDIIVKFDIQDHTPPTMNQFIEFLQSAEEWNAEWEQHVMAVHCKGGKGRTGSLIVGWLMYNRDCISLDDALNLFALCRTYRETSGALQTVETPSQVRYLGQLERLLKTQDAYVSKVKKKEVKKISAPRVVLSSLRISNVFKKKPPERMVVAIHRFSSGSDVEVVYWSTVFGPTDVEITLKDTEIRGDMRISVFDEKKLQEAREKSGGQAFRGDLCQTREQGGKVKIYIAGKEPGCLFYFLLHSAFLQNTDEGLPSGTSTGEFRVTIGPTEKSHGMCQAWKKPSKYNLEGEVFLKYKDLESIELTPSKDEDTMGETENSVKKW